MALIVKDRVKETTTTTGTGTLTLAGAQDGFQSFSVIGNGNTTYYAIVDTTNNEWEVGLGTYTASGTTLSRDTILESSNSGSAVNLQSGTKFVFCTQPAEKTAFSDDIPTNNNELTNGAGYITGNQSISLTGDASGTGTTSINVSLATDSVGSNEIAANAVSASELNVSGNGSTSQFLRSDGDGSFTWATPTDTNTTYTAGTGLSLTGTTFANTAPDQTVSLTGSGATTVTGTYPNFTISSTDTDTNTTYSAGTGLSLSGTTFSLSSTANADTVDSLHASSFLRSDANDTATGDLTFSGKITAADPDFANQLEIYRSGGANYSMIKYSNTGGELGKIGFTDTQVPIIRLGTSTTNNTIWHEGNDGSGSGLDADTVDGIQGASFLRSDADDNFSGALTTNKDATDVLNFTANSTNDNRGISFNSRTALSSDYNDGWLRLNNASEFSNGTYSPLRISSASQLVGGSSSVTSGGQVAVSQTTNPYLSFHEGATRRAYIQFLGGTDELFIFNEQGDDIRFRANASTARFKFEMSGGTNTGQLVVDSDDFIMQHANNESIIWGRKDSNTWLYYNGDWRFRTDNVGVTVRSISSTSYSQIAMTTGTNADIRGYVYANTSNNIGFLDSGGSWAIRHINDTGTYFYTDNTTTEFRVGRDTLSGDYGTVQTGTTKNGYGGYNINAQWVFMGNTSACGIYNDIDNEWMVSFTRNGGAFLRYNGSTKLATTGSGITVTGNIEATGTIASSVKAWVNFNGTGTVAIRADENVSSITDLGVGQYRINFSSSLTDANYAVNAMATAWGTTAAASSIGLRANQSPSQWEGTPTTMTTSAVDIVHSNSTSVGSEDVSYMMVSVFR